METGTFGTGFATLNNTNVRKSIIMSYMPDEKVKAFSESMPAAAVMLRGSYGFNFVIDHYSMESSDRWPVFSFTDISCSKDRVWLEVVSTPGTFKANYPYSVKSDIYIDTDLSKDLFDIIGLAGDRMWHVLGFPEHNLRYPLTPGQTA